MVTVSGTEFKVNFKKYASMAAKGMHIIVKRPKKESNLVLIDEEKYKQYNRILDYFSKLNGYTTTEEMLQNEQEITGTKYSVQFLNLFGSLNEEDLLRPEQGDFGDDIVREEL